MEPCGITCLPVKYPKQVFYSKEVKGTVMSLDFQQVRQQVSAMGERAPRRVKELRKKRQDANEVLEHYAPELEGLQAKVDLAISANKYLRCALPKEAPLNHRGATPEIPDSVTLLAADGSQINPDRHAAVDYCLVNVGAIQMRQSASEPPATYVHTQLYFDDQMYTPAGRITERMVALMRDLRERVLLAELAQALDPPIITLTDGPLELWVGREGDLDAREYEVRFKEYLAALRTLCGRGASTAGYVDRPRGDLVVRLLEIARLPRDQIERAGRDYRPFLGVTDVDLFYNRLEPGERSAVYGIQSRNADQYTAELALHFFYLNVGRDGDHPYPVRVEIPAWVALNEEMLNGLHAVLVQQCQILGTRTYPYLLHRSHEVAVVTQDEKSQLENMIALEMHRKGIRVEDSSHKQATKDLPGRTRM